MKVIQVGIGGMGNAWLRAVQASPHVEYAGFVEVNTATAAEQVAKNELDGSKVFASLEEALARVQADGVINVTPPQFHRQVSLTALEAGLPVLSEKPLADTLTAAQDIVDTANRTGILAHGGAELSLSRADRKRFIKRYNRATLGRLAQSRWIFLRGHTLAAFAKRCPIL